MQPILSGAPWLIAHKSMLGIDKPNKITLNGQDYVLWQNSEGSVFAQLISGFIPWLELTKTHTLHSIPPIQTKMTPVF